MLQQATCDVTSNHNTHVDASTTQDGIDGDDTHDGHHHEDHEDDYT